MRVQTLSLLLLAALVGTLAGGADARGQEAEPLARQARDVLSRFCARCHGLKGSKEGGVDYILDAQKLAARRKLIPGDPKKSRLLRLVTEGDMPPEGEAPRPTKEQIAILEKWIAAGAAPESEAIRPAPESPTGDVLAGRVKEIFRARCLECHGGSKTNAGVRILDHALLLKKKKLVAGQAEESPLFVAITASDDNAMPPPGQPRLPPEEVELVRRWIAAGAVPFPADAAAPTEEKKDAALRDVVGVEYVLKKILADVRGLPAEDRRHVRYFSLNHVLTAGATAEQLDLYREALAKTVNHLSWEPKVVRPRAIDAPTNTVYAIDLRHLGWHRQPFGRFRGETRLGQSAVNLFDLALLEYPYGIVQESSETFDRVAEEFLTPAGQVRPIAYVRIDWFVSVVTQPPLYEDFLQLPHTLTELEQLLGVDSEADLRDSRAQRAGMTVSGVSRNNRVVERHTSKHGVYWKSFDFRTSKGAENMFKDPIAFRPSGGEMIFSLPNGLQGYFVSDARGERVEAAPTDIVTDRFAEDKTVRNGLACMRCHDQGMKGFADTVRPALLRLPGSQGFDHRAALRLYPEQTEMDQHLKEDGDRFLAALRQGLGKPQGREPLIPVTKRFLDDPVALTRAAGELGLAEGAGLEPVFRLPQFTGLGLMPLASQGVVRRDAWEEYFDQVVRGLGLGVPVAAVDGVLRRDHPAGTAPLEVELKTNKRNNLFEPGDELVVLVTNRSSKPVYIELIGTSTRGRKVLLTDADTMVRPGDSYRFPRVGGIKIKGGLGKEQVTLFASEEAFPAVDLLRGRGVTDRVVHGFCQLRRQDGRMALRHDPARVVKKTIDIETR